MKTSALFYICLFGVVLVQAQIGGYALQFDGTDDYVNCGTSLSISGDLTISAWVMSSGVTSSNGAPTDYIVARGDDDQKQNSFGIALCGYPNTHAALLVNTSTPQWAASPDGSILTNTWYHIAGVISGSTAYIYINGALAGQNAIVGSISPTTRNLYIGKQDRSVYEYYFHGLIDEVQIWNTALSITQIRQYMYHELNGNETNLVAYYKFNATSGTSLDDLTSNNNDGTLMNMTSDDWVTSSAFFGPKNCLDFDGVDDYVSIPDNSAHEPASLTLEAWILVNGNGTTKTGGHDKQFMCFKKNTRTDYFEGYVIYYAENDKSFKGGVSSSAGSQRLISTPANSIDFSTWYHVALVADNTDLTLYLNGISQGTASTGFALNYGSDPLYFGRSGVDTWEGYFNGKLDDVRIWNTKRTATQIRENMFKSLSGSEDNLVAYYRFDQAAGTKLYDQTTTANHGTLTNMETSDWVTSSAYNTWIGSESGSWSTATNWWL